MDSRGKVDTMAETIEGVESVQSFEVKAVNAAYFYSLIRRLNKRAVKLGLAEITYRVVDRRVVVRRAGYSDEWREFLCTVEVVGKSPKLDGWRIAGVIEHLSGGNLLRDSGAGVDLSVYRDDGAHCDHCNTVRRRKETVVLLNDSGAVVRVGKSCLKDYLGGATIAQLAWWADVCVGLAGACDGDFDGGGYGGPPCWDLLWFLSWCAACVRDSGGVYVTRTAARDREDVSATCDHAISWLCMNPSEYEKARQRGHAVTVEACDVEAARVALEWTQGDLDAARGSDAGIGDYQHNLGVIVACGETGIKQAGYASSILGYHRRGVARAEEIEARAAAKAARLAAVGKSSHVGTVGEQVLLEVVIGRTIVCGGGQWGPSYLVKMETIEGGDQVAWFASSDLDLQAGARCFVRGTVKKHDEYQGVAQTTLTRCAVRCPVCEVEGRLTASGKVRKNGAPFKNLHKCDHYDSVPESCGGGRQVECTGGEVDSDLATRGEIGACFAALAG
jgi:hypothetical protein